MPALLSPAQLALAIRDNNRDFYAYVARNSRRGGHVHTDHELCWLSVGLPAPTFNIVATATLTPQRVPSRAAELQAWYQEKSLPWLWPVWSCDEPEDLGLRLAALGFQHQFTAPGMYANLQEQPQRAPLPPGLTITRVTDAAGFATFDATCIAGFGAAADNPDMIDLAASFHGATPDEQVPCYIGWVDGQPVATGELMLSAQVAGVQNIATIEAYRGRGIGAAMTQHLMDEARRLGYAAAVLQSSPMGARVYRRLGFVDHVTVSFYAPPTEA